MLLWRAQRPLRDDGAGISGADDVGEQGVKHIDRFKVRSVKIDGELSW